MAERVVLVLNGGGALGAYQAGVYKALVRRLDAQALRSMVIVGASIGAINGFMIAAHARKSDGGADTLERFWHSLGQRPLPFFPWPHLYLHRLNATLTGLALGNPRMFNAIPGGLLGGLIAYPFMAAFRNDALQGTLAAWGARPFRSHGMSSGPRLMVRAIDLQGPEEVWFDSEREFIEPLAIAGSSAVPLLFAPVRYQGRALWDGDIWPQSILPQALARLREEDSGARYHVLSVELFKAERQLPVGLGANLHQLRTAIFAARSNQDAAMLPGHMRLTRIRRLAHAYEQASAWLLDWAPDRIEGLIRQGEQDTEAALASEEPAEVLPMRRSR